MGVRSCEPAASAGRIGGPEDRVVEQGLPRPPCEVLVVRVRLGREEPLPLPRAEAAPEMEPVFGEVVDLRALAVVFYRILPPLAAQ